MRIKVFKFGGSSFPNLVSYNKISSYVQKRLEQDADAIVLVVSAMSGTTGKLQEAALTVNPSLSSEITDSILATGEMVAAALMRAALEKDGVPAAQLTGYQLGIVTDERFTRARPIRCDSEIILKLLNTKKVIVVAGGQARTEDGRLSMLGRNSSDMSAVLIAGMLGLSDCEIFSDVPGVYSADPYIVKEAVRLEKVPYDLLITMSKAGAKVLHYGAIECAQQMKVKILCRANGEDDFVGSIIGEGEFQPMISLNKNIVTIKFESRERLLKSQKDFLKAGVIVHEIQSPSQFVLALWTENRAWPEVVASLGLTFSHTTEVMVSLVHNEGLTSRLIQGGEAEDYLKCCHRIMYGKHDSANHFDPKIRSQLSGLLVG